jgi:hypothetical protein
LTRTFQTVVWAEAAPARARAKTVDFILNEEFGDLLKKNLLNGLAKQSWLK